MPLHLVPVVFIKLCSQLKPFHLLATMTTAFMSQLRCRKPAGSPQLLLRQQISKTAFTLSVFTTSYQHNIVSQASSVTSATSAFTCSLPFQVHKFLQIKEPLLSLPECNSP